MTRDENGSEKAAFVYLARSQLVLVLFRSSQKHVSKSYRVKGQTSRLVTEATVSALTFSSRIDLKRQW